MVVESEETRATGVLRENQVKSSLLAPSTQRADKILLRLCGGGSGRGEWTRTDSPLPRLISGVAVLSIDNSCRKAARGRQNREVDRRCVPPIARAYIRELWRRVGS